MAVASAGTSNTAYSRVGLLCNRILCWVDSMDEPEGIVDFAKSLATPGKGECHVVMGLDSLHRLLDLQARSGMTGLGGQAPLTPEVIAQAKRRLTDLYRGEVQTMVLPGHPIAEVRRYARRHQVSLIVMGLQGLAVEAKYGERLFD